MKSHFIKMLIISALLVIGTMGLSACGVKPSRVDAPPTVTNDSFPKQYPSQ